MRLLAQGVINFEPGDKVVMINTYSDIVSQWIKEIPDSKYIGTVAESISSHRYGLFDYALVKYEGVTLARTIKCSPRILRPVLGRRAILIPGDKVYLSEAGTDPYLVTDVNFGCVYADGLPDITYDVYSEKTSSEITNVDPYNIVFAEGNPPVVGYSEIEKIDERKPPFDKNPDDSQLMSSYCINDARITAKLFEKEYLAMFGDKFSYKKIIFSGPCTIVIWDDRTKTIARCAEGDRMNPETGVAICFMKRAIGEAKAKKLLKNEHDRYYADYKED